MTKNNARTSTSTKTKKPRKLTKSELRTTETGLLAGCCTQLCCFGT